MSIGETLGIWVAALLTLVMFSFIYRDNPVYKIGEHLFLGVSLGYSWCLYYYSNIYPQAIAPLMPGPEPKDWSLLTVSTVIPVVLGVFILLRIVPQLAWLSRYSFAIYIGGAAGISVPFEMSGRLLPLISGMMIPFNGPLSQVITNIVILLGVTATVVYFFFSVEHRGFIGRFSRIGVLFVMISFGASFGNTVMARVSLLIGRFQFLIYEWFQKGVLGQGG